MADLLLAGETAVVTGAASGIGRGIARTLRAEGVALALVDIDAVHGQELAKELDATFIAADLSRLDGIERTFETAVTALGRVTLLVHSASPRRLESQTVLQVTSAEWDAMVNGNLRSGFILGQAAAKHMIENAIRGRMRSSPPCTQIRRGTCRITAPQKPARRCWSKSSRALWAGTAFA